MTINVQRKTVSFFVSDIFTTYPAEAFVSIFCFLKLELLVQFPASNDNFFKVLKYCINPCPAELLQLYFSSFEAGIANAISSFK